MVFLRDGVLRGEYHDHHRDAVMELEASAAASAFDTGRWRQIRVEKRRDSLTLLVDGGRHRSVTARVPRRLHLGRHLSIGGWHSQHEEDRVNKVRIYCDLISTLHNRAECSRTRFRTFPAAFAT